MCIPYTRKYSYVSYASSQCENKNCKYLNGPGSNSSMPRMSVQEDSYTKWKDYYVGLMIDYTKISTNQNYILYGI